MAGERSDPKTLEFFHSHLDVPIIEQYWQTETGWPMTTQCLGMKQDHPSGTFPGIKYGSVSRPVPGYDMHVLTPDSGVDDEHHSHNHEAEVGSDQELVVKLPLPPGETSSALTDMDGRENSLVLCSGTLTTLYNNEEDFHAKYLRRFPGYYHTGDTGHIDEDGYVYVRCPRYRILSCGLWLTCLCVHSQIMSRTDDVINVAGHRICTGSIEEVILQIPEVVECAVVRVCFFDSADLLWC